MRVEFVSGLEARADDDDRHLLGGGRKPLHRGDRPDHVVMRLADRRLVQEHPPGAEQGAVLARRLEGREALRDLLQVAVVEGALLGGELARAAGSEGAWRSPLLKPSAGDRG